MFYVYKITNVINDKVYIGKSYHPQERFQEHIRDAKSGADRVLPRAIRKYGEDSFVLEVIAEYGNESDQDLAESEYIRHYDCCVLDGADRGYNMTRGGDGFSSEETSFYLNKRTAEGKNPFSRGGSYYDQVRQRQTDLIESNQHIFQQEEHRKKISDLQLRRIAEGNHLFAGDDCGERSSALQRRLLEEGRHHFLDPVFKAHQSVVTKQQLDNGTHNFNKESTCPHCGKVGKGPMMRRWHFDNCGVKFVHYNDGVKNFRIPDTQLPDPLWVRGMVPKR